MPSYSRKKSKKKKSSTSPSKGVDKKKLLKLSKARRAGLIFPPSRFQKKLRTGTFAKRIGVGAGLYMAAVIEYLCAEILELAGAAAFDFNKKRIIPRHIMLSVRGDDELTKLLQDVHICDSGVVPNVHRILMHTLQQRRKLQKKGELPPDSILATEVEEYVIEEEPKEEKKKRKKKTSSSSKSASPKKIEKSEKSEKKKKRSSGGSSGEKKKEKSKEEEESKGKKKKRSSVK